MTRLFEDQMPFDEGMLDVEGHQIYWRQSGYPDGIPILLLHGGPGSGSSPINRRLFDPKIYRIIAFDQRGCGKSIPNGSLDRNETAYLISDIEALRRKFDLETWVLFGGSWGASLALAYGQAYPHHCRAFILRASFLCRKWELDWWLNGIEAVFPDHVRKFREFIPAAEQEKGLLAAYYQRLLDESRMREAAIQWKIYQAKCGSLIPPNPSDEAFDNLASVIGARIECHYFLNNCFMNEGSLLENLEKITHLPAYIVHGRYDMICPIRNAFELADAWSNARLRIVPDAGHGFNEQGMIVETMKVADELASLVGSR